MSGVMFEDDLPLRILPLYEELGDGRWRCGHCGLYNFRADRVKCRHCASVRPTQQPKQPEKAEQLQLFPEPAPAPAGPARALYERKFERDDRGLPYVINKVGRRLNWHDPVTATSPYEFYLWVVRAIPDRGCKRCTEIGLKGPHYHCYVCSHRIEYGELHGGSEVHVCINCLRPRTFGRQVYPDYEY